MLPTLQNSFRTYTQPKGGRSSHPLCMLMESVPEVAGSIKVLETMEPDDDSLGNGYRGEGL